MDIGSYTNRSQRKGLIIFSLIMAILFVLSAVQILGAAGGETAVQAAHKPDGGIFTDTIPSESEFDLIVTDGLSATGGITEYLQYMPVILNPLTIEVDNPNSANQWTVSWGNVFSPTGFIIQESNDPDFAEITNEVMVGDVNSYQFNNPLSFNNVYYYRVRPVYANDNLGYWSNTVSVIGGYRDDFSDLNSGWVPMRRTTYLEETNAYYGTGSEAGNLIIIVADRWDWLIASPLAPAPEPPYAIQFRARVHDSSNLVSGGMVFGGDWNGQPCPEFGNIYATTNCFNHFYNFNMIFYGPLKLLHEQVDNLFYCPNCMGSQIKRLGPLNEVDPILGNGPSKEWHTYRVEVRNSGVTFFVDGSQKGFFSDTTYINEPYFGVFASTDEYKPSIWFYDYFQVAVID